VYVGIGEKEGMKMEVKIEVYRRKDECFICGKPLNILVLPDGKIATLCGCKFIGKIRSEPETIIPNLKKVGTIVF
jgi:hypothetical protein